MVLNRADAFASSSRRRRPSTNLRTPNSTSPLAIVQVTTRSWSRMDESQYAISGSSRINKLIALVSSRYVNSLFSPGKAYHSRPVSAPQPTHYQAHRYRRRSDGDARSSLAKLRQPNPKAIPIRRLPAKRAALAQAVASSCAATPPHSQEYAQGHPAARSSSSSLKVRSSPPLINYRLPRCLASMRRRKHGVRFGRAEMTVQRQFAAEHHEH